MRVPENSLRWRWGRRRGSVTQIQIPIIAGMTIRRVFIGSDDPAVHANRGPVNRSGRVVVLVLDLDFHTPKPLAIPPLETEIRRRRCLLPTTINTWSQKRRRRFTSSSNVVVVVVVSHHRVFIHFYTQLSHP